MLSIHSFISSVTLFISIDIQHINFILTVISSLNYEYCFIVISLKIMSLNEWVTEINWGWRIKIKETRTNTKCNSIQPALVCSRVISSKEKKNACETDATILLSLSLLSFVFSVSNFKDEMKSSY